MMGFIRYRNIIDPLNGPITKVTAWQKTHPLLGDYFESVASLIPELCPPKSTDIYAHGAGGGASKTKVTAVHKAISEALERWAYFHVSLNETNLKEILGLETDSTSTGFACHPSYFSGPTRKKSHEEAVERWAVYNWWIGKLPARVLYKNCCNLQIEIVSPFEKIKVFCCASKGEGGFYTYGFSAADSLERAKLQALIEQTRNERALTKFPSNQVPSFRGEKRLFYFSTDEGFAKFNENLEKSLLLRGIPERPRKLVDREVKGPWTKYARVWRTLYEGGEVWHHSANEKIFLF
jgi:hypothetical protein